MSPWWNDPVEAHDHRDGVGTFEDPSMDLRVDVVLAMVREELVRAIRKHPRPLNSPHEGFGVIFEEFMVELAPHAWHDTGRSVEAAGEAVQVAAMAVRYVVDLCEPAIRAEVEAAR